MSELFMKLVFAGYGAMLVSLPFVYAHFVMRFWS
jgi:hypothetical protein